MNEMCEFNTESKSSVRIKLLRKYLKLKLLEDNMTFCGHSVERNHVYELFKKTIVNGESHSAMMIGPRGCGKTTLINSVLHQLSKEVDVENDAIIVKLNGVVHNDDKTALKSITAQMRLENAVGDRVFGTFAENLSYLVRCLCSGADRRCRSVVFVLERCDLLCRGGRHQALLYNLFDMTHTQQAPLCVLGTSSRLDVMDLLEKRVKSRFSQRHIFLFPHEGARAALDPSGDTEVEAEPPERAAARALVRLLSVPQFAGDRSKTDRRNGTAGTPAILQFHDRKRKPPDAVIESDSTAQYAVPEAVLLKCRTDVSEFRKLKRRFITEWNDHIQRLAEDQTVLDSLEKLCYYTVNEQVFKNVLFRVVTSLSASKQRIDAADIAAAIDNAVAPEHRVRALQSLSVLELSLVIAMKHATEIFDGQPMNFEMVLNRYTKFASTNSSTQAVPRAVILKAFEHLQVLELIVPAAPAHGDTSAARVQKEYQLYALAVPDEEILEAVKGFKALPTEIMHWAGNSVV